MEVRQLRTIEYREAVALQEQLRGDLQRGTGGEVLLLLEHPPVYTLGRRSEAKDLPMGREWYLGNGIDVVETDRGGKLTYHGPGQLVGYPILHVEDVIAYVRAIERAIVAALATEGIGARAREDEGADFTGVWVEDRKIASIGVHVQRGVTTHGFAVNVDNDLQPFEWVVPCGLPEVRMTSVCKELGESGRLERFRQTMADAFMKEVGRGARTPQA